MTFSLIGRCAETGMLGVAITTSSICVGARCPHARAGVGAVATQNVTLPSLGPALLEAMAGGLGAREALAAATAGLDNLDYRQLAAIDAKGRTAHFTGAKTLGTHSVAEGRNCIAAGNLLENEEVTRAMIHAFEAHESRHLASRLLHGLASGLVAGGEVGPVKSAALLVVHEHPWPLVDLRVDWDEDDPVARLRRLWEAYEPQMMDYVTRAVDPASAPAYGVPGDL